MLSGADDWGDLKDAIDNLCLEYFRAKRSLLLGDLRRLLVIKIA